VLSNFAPFGSGVGTAVSVGMAYIDDDATADVVVAAQDTSGTVRVFNGATGSMISGDAAEFAPFGGGAGVSIAGGNDPQPAWEPPVELPVVSITAPDPTASEADVSSGVFVFTRTLLPDDPLTVTFAVRSKTGDATRGTDYKLYDADGNELTANAVVIPANEESTFVLVKPIDDSIQDMETVQLTVTAAAVDPTYAVDTDAGAALETILDDDPPVTDPGTEGGAGGEGSIGGGGGTISGKPTILIGASDPNASEDGLSTGAFTVSVFAEPGSTLAQAVTVYYTVSVAGEFDATPGVDYVALSGSQTIAQAAAKSSFLVVPLDDELVDGARVVSVTLLDGGTKYSTVTEAISATVTIADNDKPRRLWAPINNDNDNYNFDTSNEKVAGTSTTPIYDLAEATQVVGENDLIALKINPAPGANQNDKVRVRYTSPNIKLWKSADKDAGAVVSGTTEFSATKESTIYVEGLALSTSVSKGPEIVTFEWVSGANPNQKRDYDKANVIVYGVYGAQNVPGYSIQTYKVFIPDTTGKTKAEWGGFSGGTQSGVASGPEVAGDYAVSTVRIHWGAGEVVGKYRVTVPDGFYIDREVNVVKVDINFGDAATNKIDVGKAKNMAQNAPNQLNQIISSTKSDTDPAMIGGFTVSRIAGPLVNGARRGGRFIVMGFMQTVKIGLHGDFSLAVPAFRMVSNVEGKLYLDSLTPNDAPWAQRIYNPPPDPGSQVYLPIDTDQVKSDTPFSYRDTPSVTVVGNMVENGDRVTFFSLVLDFKTMFGVRTIDATSVDTAITPTIRASGTWGWNGSGFVDAKSVWASNVATPFTTSGKFVEVTDGRVLDPALYTAAASKGITARAAVNSQTWTPKFQ
jgi:hypothetical protein